MRKNNKRLMITCDGPAKNVLWDLGKKYVLTNTWGAKAGNCFGNPICVDYDPKKMCNLHWGWDGTTATLSYFNNFGEAAVTRALWDTKSDHLYDVVKNAVANCNFPLKGYYGDRIAESINELSKEGKKTAYDYINELNQTAAQNAAQLEAQAQATAEANAKATAAFAVQAKSAEDAKKAADPIAYEKEQQRIRNQAQTASTGYQKALNDKLNALKEMTSQSARDDYFKQQAATSSK